MLRELGLKPEYRSWEDDLKRDFFLPCISMAESYDRAVGYFSSKMLLSLCSGLKEFFRKNGKLRIVTSVELGEEDTQAIESGISKREVVERKLQEIVDSEQYIFSDHNSSGILERAIETDLLDIKIAIPKQGYGIFHEKLGIFSDQSGSVAFAGSANDSNKALEENYECIDVFTSWTDGHRVALKQAYFDSLWQKKYNHLDVYEFPEAAKKNILKIIARSKGTPKRNKWAHQEDAVRIFLERKRGILQMATGTGKTRTALAAMSNLFSNGHIDTAIVAADGNDLLDQWNIAIRTHLNAGGATPYTYRYHGEHKEILDFELDNEKKIIITSRAFLPRVLSRFTQHHRTLIINDEVHRLGSPSNKENLSGKIQKIGYSLGLSATPEREYDREGTDFIKNEIGDVIFEFSLEDAIQNGILCEMDYVPLRYDITQDDRNRLKDVYKRKAAREREGRPMSDQELWTELARVHKTSFGKLPPLTEYLKENSKILKNCIIFVETKDYGTQILDIVHKHIANFHTYFDGDDSEVLRRFSKSELGCLITCHRLSEGIDIQSLETVILLSSSRANLETIQRIGRCLRFDPKNPNKRATVIDFIRNPEQEGSTTADTERRQWLTELAQVRRQ